MDERGFVRQRERERETETLPRLLSKKERGCRPRERWSMYACTYAEMAEMTEMVEMIDRGYAAQ
jgi:hypothetical protein